jgi:bacterial/archaeal transporter family protein
MPNNEIKNNRKGVIMAPWLVYSLVALFLWGLWGFLAKTASQAMSSYTLLLLGLLGASIMLPVYLALFARHLRFSWHNPVFYCAPLSGVASALAAFFFYMAVSKGEASRVVAITATYPIVTLILAFIFLDEQMTIQKSAGVLITIMGVLLLSR